MNNFIEFMSKYWFQLATGLFAVVEIILIIVKRKPKSITDFKLILEEALSFVPEFVIKVEEPGNGKEKLAKVLKLALTFICRKLGRSLSDDEVVLVTECVIKKVETVLSTPTKKEIKNEK